MVPVCSRAPNIPSHQNDVTFQCAKHPVPHSEHRRPRIPSHCIYNVKEQTRLRGEAGLYALLRTEVNGFFSKPANLAVGDQSRFA
jgi:hypothetical protein